VHVIAGAEGIVLTFRDAAELRAVADHLQGFAEYAEARDRTAARSYAIGPETIPEELPAAAVRFETAAADWLARELVEAPQDREPTGPGNGCRG